MTQGFRRPSGTYILGVTIPTAKAVGYYPSAPPGRKSKFRSIEGTINVIPKVFKIDLRFFVLFVSFCQEL